MVYSTDRRSVFVDLRIHVPEKRLQLGHQTRTVLATNDYDKLKVYLYFSEPVRNSSTEILGSLNVSEGSLLPVSGENLGNRRFGFQVSRCSAIIFLDAHLAINCFFFSCTFQLSLLPIFLHSGG